MSSLKGLFVTHDVGDYGASRSLQLLLNNLPGVEADMMVRPGAITLDAARRTFKADLGRIHECPLPWDDCHVAHLEGAPRQMGSSAYGLPPHIALRRRIRRFVDEAIAGTEAHRIIERGGYDFIHLNSLVLHQLVRKRLPFVVHVRELYDGSNRAVFKSLATARGVIFIDRSTQHPFAAARLKRYTLLNNPVEMSPVNRLRASGTDFLPGCRGKTIFAIIGQIFPDKGVQFVIEAFKQVRSRGAVLLIVGSDVHAGAYAGECRKSAAADQRIVFLGHEPEIFKIYAMSDYLIRGEASERLGRTALEALYAGCHVVVPGRGFYGEFSTELKRFRGAMHLYEPRDASGLVGTLNALADRKIVHTPASGNTAAVAGDFVRFVESLYSRRLDRLTPSGTPP